MAEPQVVINKSWAEHKAEEREEFLLSELERQRRNKNLIKCFLILLGIALFIYVYIALKEILAITIVIAVIVVVILIVRKLLKKRTKTTGHKARGKKSRHKRKSKKSWERIKPPSWVARKMKRRKSNIVNGEHYVYKREKGNYYRKRR